ncbi:transcription termination/antitermination protein NusA [Alkalicella caledoniensis]|uniref:Transcription termination/antitermination protein NusA n=1 Tax=Alkalicella caledoniensis TaxID=2731377 RepID=A0A7G9WCQ0_ALKCA|nr:transcription termination factor NusA [Alkalicella caledoniensis]QNO16462.1 transcription termination/antitermination protein NusA [Alkalicella caledoniensis]
MDSVEFLEALKEISKEKGVNEDIMYEALEAALIAGYKKDNSSAENVYVEVNKDKGVLKLFAVKDVVKDVEDIKTQISLEEALKVNPSLNVGDKVTLEVTPKKFGRIAAQTAKGVVVQRLREAERSVVYNEFVNREQDIVSGLVQRMENKNIFIDLGKTEAILPPTEQIPNEQYKQAERVKAFVLEVKNTSKGPQIFVSRSHPGMIKRLFELEVPEIFDGIVQIKSVSREAGYRSKIAVYSKDPDVDPVGACVGPKGMRVQTIVNELKGEKIDIVNWSEDPKEYISQALSPAKVVSVEVLADEKITRVVVPDNQLSLAIGKEGQNARLAAKLTGWKIDIKSESQAKGE